MTRRQGRREADRVRDEILVALSAIHNQRYKDALAGAVVSGAALLAILITIIFLY